MAESRTLHSKEHHLHQKNVFVTNAEVKKKTPKQNQQNTNTTTKKKTTTPTKKGQQTPTTTYHNLSLKEVKS